MLYNIIMKKIFGLIVKYPIVKEFIIFCSIGLTNLAVDFSVYIFLTRVVHLYYIVAAIISFVVAVTWSFYANKKWTFKYSGGNLRLVYIKFFIANSISIIFNLLIFYGFVEYWHVWDLLAKFLSSVVASFLNFSINKFWSFRIKESPGNTLSTTQ